MGRAITPDEFEALFRAVAPELWGYVRRHGADDADDLVAEVFATAWRRRADLPPPVLRRAWLFGVARRLLLADGRRVLREQSCLAEIGRRQDGGVGQSSTASSDRDVVLRALGRLSEADRELIELSEWERLTPSEIAVALGIRPGTARVRLHRARRTLSADIEIQALLGAPRGDPDAPFASHRPQNASRA